MTVELVNLENIDFNQYPKDIKSNLNIKDAQFYCGDCTSNPIMFLHHLVEWGIVEISEEDFKSFSRDIAEQYPSDPKEMKSIVNLFDNFLKKIRVRNNGATIHIIGPLLYEFSCHGITLKDYFILKIIEKLNIAQQKISILFNYQTYRFLQLHEKVISNETNQPYFDTSKGEPRSTALLYNYINKNVIPLRTFTTLIEKDFLPNINFINYTINHSQTMMTIMTPTPIDLDVITRLARIFKIPFDASSVQRLMVVLDRIMIRLKSLLTQPISQFPINEVEVRTAYYSGVSRPDHYPIETCISSRTQCSDATILENFNGERCNVTWLYGYVSIGVLRPDLIETPNICLYTEYSLLRNNCPHTDYAYSNNEKPSVRLEQLSDVNAIPEHLQKNTFAKMHTRFLDISLFGGHRNKQLLDFAKIYNSLEIAYKLPDKKLQDALQHHFTDNPLESTGAYMLHRQALANILPNVDNGNSILIEQFEPYRDWLVLLKEKYPTMGKIPRKHAHSEILHWFSKDLNNVHIVTCFYHR